MANQINIDRPRLAEYIKQHAEVLARSARLDIDLTEVETFGGGVQTYIAKVNVEFRDIPLEAVEKEA